MKNARIVVSRFKQADEIIRIDTYGSGLDRWQSDGADVEADELVYVVSPEFAEKYKNVSENLLMQVIEQLFITAKKPS
jgi:hypothetical protein